MPLLRLLLLFLALLGPLSAARAATTLVTSPQALPAGDDRIRIFLAGSIDMGRSEDWQSRVADALADADVVLFNPRRADWNPAWQASSDEPEFVRQVRWELQALEAADIVLMYFAPGSQSPVTLLEMGLHARGGKLIVAAPPGFWRKGNVDITADHYGVRRVEDIDALIAAVRERVEQMQQQQAGQ